MEKLKWVYYYLFYKLYKMSEAAVQRLRGLCDKEYAFAYVLRDGFPGNYEVKQYYRGTTAFFVHKKTQCCFTGMSFCPAM